MNGLGNRYSMDGSYNLIWDKKFPIDGDILWPSGKLMQLQRIAFGSHLREKRHIVILTPRKLIIAEQPKRDPDLPWGIIDDGSGYRFYNGELRNEEDYDASSLVKLESSSSLVGEGIGIWVASDDNRQKKVFWAKTIASSKVLKDLAEECIRQGIVEPKPSPNPILAPAKGRYVFETQLRNRIIERQFRKAAPKAEIVLLGDQMSEENFRRIIK